MAIQNINLGTAPNGVGGDTLRSTATKINENFSNATHAASRLVGLVTGNVMQVGAFGLGSMTASVSSKSHERIPSGFSTITTVSAEDTSGMPSYQHAITASWVDYSGGVQLLLGLIGDKRFGYRNWDSSIGKWSSYISVRTSANTSIDGNGFLKGASPIVKVHADKVVLNEEAEQQNVTFIKNGIGDYTINTVSGLSTDGWYLELPKDLNGNPKVAVTLSEVEGVITLKSYKRIFSMETFNFIPDLNTPLDIPTDRWIDIRLNEIPVEQPEMPLEPTEGTNTPVAEAKAPSEPVEPYSEV